MKDWRDRSRLYTDDPDEGDDAYEPCYRDGSVKHECWHDQPVCVRKARKMMEKKFIFAYGDGNIPVTVKAREIEVLEATTPAPVENLPETFRKAVEEDAVASLR